MPHYQHLLLARNLAQERFANSRAGPTIISEHLQAFLLTANAAVPPDHAIILHRWDAETQHWVKLPLTKAGEDEGATQYSPHEWHQLVHLVWQTRKAQSQQCPTNTALHHIQEPPRGNHGSPTEPHKEESQSCTLGPSRVPGHQCRNRSMDVGTTTTPTIGKGLHRMGESQLHPHGHRP